MTGGQQEITNSDAITANSLNNHYVHIFTDTNYISPTWKVSVLTCKRNTYLN